MHPIMKVVAQQKQGIPSGVYSCCSANEFVLKAVLRRAQQFNVPALIEATANQVNQYGGYTGMNPQDFFDYVLSLANELDFPINDLIFGGDHLGPLPWTHLQNEEAMNNACELIRQFVAAGFTKIHIDTSMRLSEDNYSSGLSDELIASRGARLCKIAEEAFEQRLKHHPDSIPPVYIIGSEVPTPGGAIEEEEDVHITKPEDCIRTYNSFKQAFQDSGLDDAWNRVVGIVVQPGVEFSNMEVLEYNRKAASSLIEIGRALPLVFEGHSTDYQTRKCLRQMVEDGIAILKVGPALTFELREALFALEMIEKEMLSNENVPKSEFRKTLDQVMLSNPNNWKSHYYGNEEDQRFARAFSLSDRARYYFNTKEVRDSIETLSANLESRNIPFSLLSQYMPCQFQKIKNRIISLTVENIIIDRVGDCLDDYLYACGISNR